MKVEKQKQTKDERSALISIRASTLGSRSPCRLSSSCGRRFILFTVVCRCLFTDVTQTLWKAEVSHRCARYKTLGRESSPSRFACDSHSRKPCVRCRCSQCKITVCTVHIRYMFDLARALDSKISTHLKKNKKKVKKQIFYFKFRVICPITLFTSMDSTHSLRCSIDSPSLSLSHTHAHSSSVWLLITGSLWRDGSDGRQRGLCAPGGSLSQRSLSLSQFTDDRRRILITSYTLEAQRRHRERDTGAASEIN